MDNPSSRKVNRDGDFTSSKSYNYLDIKEGTIELASYTQPGGAGTAITTVTFDVVRGRGFTVSDASIVDTNIAGYFAGTGVTPTAARSFNVSFQVNFSQHFPVNSIPSVLASLEAALDATGFAGATVNSVTVHSSEVQRQSFVVHTIIEIWGSSSTNIYTLLAGLFDDKPKLNFLAKSSQVN